MRNIPIAFHWMISRIKQWVVNNQLTTGILLIVGITLLLTSINMALYITSGTSGLDLSRPGFEQARKNALNDSSSPEFSPTGKLTQKDIEEFTKLYNDQRDRLKKMGSFDDQVLTDESLRLIVPADPTTSGE
ncbi:MAG: hypothetical protein WBB33_01855 [Candidatus Saccharimonadales bacterium]